ncbi:DNA polymerase III subunit alpha [Streptomyces sp. NBC_01242]|uniref:DNA polymerase III subunit alpha n=1 Tax=Streptomyces sp. NBC_01242 TaxID=2903795 RepID=UPI00225687CF|nr:DNA polymerase III subunit alpha [Streptomyces sp. NBC_01242]MCX4799694.1 DNA polymerase III subunit alpha [Streptomyces sp. NBC_01242]
MLRLVNSYASERFPGAEHRVGGLKLHLPALVEHDEDGTRWLLIPGGYRLDVTTSTWTRALTEGAAGILYTMQDGVGAIAAHQLDEHGRETSQGSITFGYEHTAIFSDADGIPTYHEVLDQTEARDSGPHARPAGFVHLHTHSEYSPLDGLSRMDEIAAEVTRHGQSAIGITDHGNCAGHPALQRAADAAGIKPIFGIEANLTDDRLMRGETVPDDDPRFHGFTKTVVNDKGEAKEVPIPPARMLQNHYWHLCLFAENNEGLRNLWAASTESFRDGFYGRPRMDWDTLARHSEGVIASTGCLRGPVAVALKNGDYFLARDRLTRLMDLYPGRLYVELQPNDMPDQVKLNKVLVAFAREFDLPLLATVDSHFPTKDDADAHQVWIACQTQKDVQDEGDLFKEDLGLYLKSESEVRAGLAYLGQDVVDESVANTVALADRCTARIEGGQVTPSFTGDPAEDVRRLHELCTSQANWDRLPIETHEQNQAYRDRYNREMSLLVDKGFCGYYLMVSDYVGHAKENGILVGPGRGSGGGSLVAYLSRITSLDPVKHDLLFERFLTKGRNGLPDFDVDFPASKKGEILGYLRQRWGADRVVTIGSEGRLKNKAVLDNLLRAMKSRLPEGAEADLKAVKELIKEAEAGTAGLGMSWEQLWIEHADQLQPYADRYPELFAMAEKLVGRLKSYGRHAAGVVISTSVDIADWMPMRAVDGEEQMVTQWSMDDVEAIGGVKFDILTLRNLDTIQRCIDLVQARYGIRIDLEAWDKEFEDPDVWDEIARAHTLGIFQIETPSGTRLCDRMRPANIGELSDMITIVRPGPMNSGLTDAYLRRRAGEQAVSYPDPRLEDVLAPTQGAMIYQEQVMAVTRIIAGYDESEADAVRKILGKKKVAAIESAGQEFLSRADMPQADAARLWAQMAEFSKYGFNKSHAYAYAFLAYWTAFLKVNYRREFLVAAMSTVDNDRLPEFVREARRVGVSVQPPDINLSGQGFSVDPAEYAIRYGLDSVKGVGTTAVGDITPHQPYSAWDDFIERKGPKANAGVVALLARIGAFDSLVPNRRGLEAKLLAKKTGEEARCSLKKDDVFPKVLIERLPEESDEEFDKRYEAERVLQRVGPATCTFDWTTEPVPVNKRTGKKLKQKPPAKKCTKACRQYAPRPAMEIDSINPYTDEDIRQIELEMLGCFLSSTPFDRLDPDHREACLHNATAIADGPNGNYIVAAIIASARPHRSIPMGFVSLETEASTLSAAVFQDAWAVEKNRLNKGQLCFAEVRKTDRGLNLVAYQPV